MKKIEELIAAQRELSAKMANAEGENLTALQREYDANKREIELINQEAAAMRNKPAVKEATKNERMHAICKAVREKTIGNEFEIRSDSQQTITSTVIATGDVNNMVSAGIPLEIKDLINPLEMGLIYDKLGIKVATNVHGQIQWPCLDSLVEVSVGGELDEVDTQTLDFSKLNPVPVKLGISFEVSNEAINDESFDLWSKVVEEANKANGRVLNKRVLALSAPAVKSFFAGPLVSRAQSATYAGDVPTYKELKQLKGKVLATGAEMAGFCYIMDAAMFSALEAQPKDAGSGRFVIEGGKIDGDTVFLTNLAEYANKVVAGCFGYEALNEHGNARLVIDPYTKAKKDVTVFTLNSWWSMILLIRDGQTNCPFAIMSKATAPTITGDAAVELAATATAANRVYATSNGAPVIVSNAASLPEWLQVAVASNGKKVTFTPTAYAHAESGDNPRTFTVKLGIANETSNLDVVVSQPMAAE